MKQLVVIESPYSGDVMRNTEYAQAAMLDSLQRGEVPMLSHLLYTQVLDDESPADRRLGMSAGWEWYRVCDKVIVYRDYGITKGMQEGINLAMWLGKTVESRKLYA